MNVLSLFSGAGGLDLGLTAAGMTVAGMCELGWVTAKRDDGTEYQANTFTREMLRRHWPDVPLRDDVTTLNPEEFRGRVDLVAGGSPCQDLSVAGRRRGLDGARSGLFWHQCRIADQIAAPWVLWENVAGALSSNGGADFASVLWGLTGALPRVPDGGWRTAGVVVGPKRTAVWRLLDARWFGVAQRRRRVFVVAGSRGDCGPEVLLEPDGVRGDLEPGGPEGQAVAALTARGVGTCGPDDNQAQAGHLVTALTTKCGVGFDDQQVGQLVPMAVSENQRGEVLLTSYSRQITTGGSKPGQGYPAALVPAIGFGWSNAAAQGDDVVIDGVAALRTKMQPAALTPELAVRRLTPRECERLMGWPDDHTRWGATEAGDVVEIADSHRYRACGNGVVAPQGEWVGRRILEASR